MKWNRKWLKDILWYCREIISMQTVTGREKQKKKYFNISFIPVYTTFLFCSYPPNNHLLMASAFQNE